MRKLDTVMDPFGQILASVHSHKELSYCSVVLEPLEQMVSLLKAKHAPGLGRILWDLFDKTCGPLLELSRRRGPRLPHAHVVTQREGKPIYWEFTSSNGGGIRHFWVYFTSFEKVKLCNYGSQRVVRVVEGVFDVLKHRYLVHAKSRCHCGGTLVHIISLSANRMESISSHSYAVNETSQEHCETLQGLDCSHCSRGVAHQLDGLQASWSSAV